MVNYLENSQGFQNRVISCQTRQLISSSLKIENSYANINIRKNLNINSLTLHKYNLPFFKSIVCVTFFNS